ncbi:MAG: hypothetical protein IAE97_10520 [Chthoniobacterales bacterium]|nr:hypothetical protein [Chthoniobacterales bacterium]
MAAIGKGIYDATASASEFDQELRRIERGSLGGAQNRSLGELESALDSIKKAREENQKELEGTSRNYFKTAGSELSQAFARTGSAISGSKIRVMSPAEREDALREAEQKALDRVAEKQKQIWAIEAERLRGGKESAEIMKIEADYAEKIQAAISQRNLKLQAQLKLEKEAQIASAEAQQGVRAFARDEHARIGSMAAGISELGVTLPEEQAQRASGQLRVEAARSNFEVAEAASNAQPGDKGLAADAESARNMLRVAQSELARWERDVKRAKGDTMAAIEADQRARVQALNGEERLAEVTKRRADQQAAITRALREGNSALAQQLQKGGGIDDREQMRGIITNPNGSLKSSREIKNDLREQQKQAKKVNRALDRYERDGYLVNTKRDMQGRITGGLDLLSGRRVNIDPKTGNAFTREHRGGLGRDNAVDSFFVRNTNLGGQQASREMNHRLGEGERKRKREGLADDANRTTASKKDQPPVSAAMALTRIHQILEGWSSGGE